MTRIKYCGIKENTDIDVINRIRPDYIGFVFWQKSRRNIDEDTAGIIGKKLDPSILKVGVFVDEDVKVVAGLLNKGIIDIAQLHGNEDEAYIAGLRELSDKDIIKAVKIKEKDDVAGALKCSADLVLLDAGMGDGRTFEWSWLEKFDRPYILAGGLDPSNVRDAVEKLHPYGVDVSSGIETDGCKDISKMEAFAEAVRREK